MKRKHFGVLACLVALVLLVGVASPSLAQEGPQGNANCRDGIDNKPGDNGRIDFNDPLCVEKPGALYWPPITPDPCNDGLDNDGDGTADYYGTTTPARPFDPDCRVEVSVPNDTNTYTWDPSGNQRWRWCSDGVDNDGDGLIDAADPNCKETGTTLCTNNLDDDYDGIWDFGPNYAVSGGKPVVAFSGWGDSSCHETLCQDTVDNDGDGKTDGADEDCQCLHDVVDEYLALPGFGNNACTANDTSFVLVGLGVQGDGCLNPTDTITMFFEGRLKTTAQTRYDLGMWIALDGGDAYDYNSGTKGWCGHMILRPGSGAVGDCTTTPNTTCSTIVDQTGLLQALGGISSHDGPYRQGESKVDELDRCAEISQESWTVPEEDAVIDLVQNPPQDLVVYAGTWVSDAAPGASVYPWDLNVRPQPQPYTFLCQDIIGVNATTLIPNGFADIGTCASWDQQSNSLANEFSQAYPGTSAKCRCERTPTDIPVPNLRMACSNETPPPGGVLDPGEAVTNRVSLTNVLATPPATNSCTPDLTKAPNLRCGAAAYVMMVISFDASRGQITGTPTEIADQPGSVVVDNTNGKIYWTPSNWLRNPTPTTPPYAYTLGIVSANPTTPPHLDYTFTLNACPGPAPCPTTPISFGTQVYWGNGLTANSKPDDNSNGTVTLAEAQAYVANPNVKLQACTDCTCSQGFGTTPVTLAAAGATRHGGIVRFAWSTATEVENVGFNIYGRTAAGWQRLNSDLIPAVGGGIVPQSYEVTLAVPEGVTEFYIEDVDRGGKATAHREFTAVDDGREPRAAGMVAGAGAVSSPGGDGPGPS